MAWGMVAAQSSASSADPRTRGFVILRRLTLAIVAIATVFAVSGCVVLKDVTPTQLSTIGDVQITGTICVSGSSACPGNGNTTVNAGNNAQSVQLLVAYRVPVGVIAPASLRFTGDIGTGPLFTPNATYTSELQRLSPAPAGMQWIGYSSSLFLYTPPGTPTSAAIVARFVVPKGPDGLQPSTVFPFRMVAGTRAIDATHLITAAVACGNNIADFNSTGSDGQTVCIDSPAPATFATDNAISTRDLQVTAGTPPAGTPGTVVGVPFSAKFSGTAGAAANFALTATTTIPGSTPSVSPGALAPTTNSTTPVLASVPVPAGTKAGTYPVTLTATVGTETRVASSSITVTTSGGANGGGGGGTVAGRPTLSNLSVSPKYIARKRFSQPATLQVTLSQAGTLSVAVTRVAGGRKKNGHCVAPTRRLIANGARRCTRFVPITTIVKASQPAGLRRVTFSGRRRTPGVYRLRVTVRSAGILSLPKTATVIVTS